MKKIILLLCVVLAGTASVRADEGMWFLKLMELQHLEDSLRKAGLQLPASELYSEMSPSLRECVGIFGGGCTGEVVSSEGLVFTNHHCGFSFVHEMSTQENDYSKNGYFAHSRAEELRTPDELHFTFVKRISDVTDIVEKVAKECDADAYAMQTQDFLTPLADSLLLNSEYGMQTGMSARIEPYYNGNQFYILFEQTFYDIRLVASPPNNVGQFGGNTDNWMWPRQNADFAVFRIYADKDGNPAPYSPENVPLHCEKYLPISLQGVQEGDYAMVMGFPGSTSRYLTAAEVNLRTDCINKPVVLAGEPLLKYMKQLMDQSDENRLALEDDYFSLGNMVKNFQGMNEAVKNEGLLDQKKAEEDAFRAYIRKTGKQDYEGIIEKIDTLCQTFGGELHDLILLNYTLGNRRVSVSTELVDNFIQALPSHDEEEIAKTRGALLSNLTFLSEKMLRFDEQQARMLAKVYLENHRQDFIPSFLEKGLENYYAQLDSIYKYSVFTDSLRLVNVLMAGDTLTLQRDPLYQHDKELTGFVGTLYIAARMMQNLLAKMDKAYVNGLCEMYDWQKSPDANMTLRMTYGHVCDLQPTGKESQGWRTTLDGMFEKESKTESDYFVNDTLRTLYLAKDFGRYAREDGKLPACFLTNNDITGGNSGSPVMNARGELIGLAFDGNIESLSSDLKYNPRLQRCINVDIRYVLFILEKFGKARYLFNELDLR